MIKWLREHIAGMLLYRMQIKWRMVLYFLLFLLLPFLLAGNRFLKRTQAFEARELSRLLSQTQTAGSLIDSEIEAYASVLDAFLICDEASDALAQGLTPENGVALLRICDLLSASMTYQQITLTPWWAGESADRLLPLSAHPLYQKILDLSPGDSLMVDDYRMQGGERIEGISLIRTRKEQPHLLAAQLFIPGQHLNALLKPLLPTALSEFYVLNDKGIILLSTGGCITGVSMHGFDRLSEAPCAHFTGEYEGNAVNYSSVHSSTGIYLVLLTPLVELDASWQKLQIYLVYFLLILLAGGAIMLVLIYEGISTPLHQLRLSMEDVSAGKLECLVIYERKDEFSELMISYGRMLEQIRHIIAEMLRLEKVKRQQQNLARESEIKALQAQINPHMLYNTLDSINWLALKYGARDISSLIRNLANFFRYSLNKGNDYITFGQELKMIDSYLSIQRVRFRDKLDYEIDFPEELLSCYTLKLIMQPFVENCVVHAFNQKGQKGFILISAVQQGDDLLLYIRDNGVGADTERMQEYLQDTGRQAKHYGMRNVAERLRLCFGERYTIRFIQNEDGGLTVSILLPIIRDLEAIS